MMTNKLLESEAFAGADSPDGAACSTLELAGTHISRFDERAVP
jgi:hypothetical protein